MVKRSQKTAQQPDSQEAEEAPFKSASFPIADILENRYRLNARSYGTEIRRARDDLEKCKWPKVNLCGHEGLASAYTRPRFKRHFVPKSNFPIYQPSQIDELCPKPSAYIAGTTETSIGDLRVKKGQVLLTCSGTIGKCSYVRDTINGYIFSHDLIRIEPEEYSGYIYAYLKSDVGRTLVTAPNYGAVVRHIEAGHLNNLPIPNPPVILKKMIHDIVEKSYRLRDESNELISEAQNLLLENLKLPSIDTLHKEATRHYGDASMPNWSIPIHRVGMRLDATYHNPIVKVIEKHLHKNAKEVVSIGNRQISRKIILPSRFGRVYVGPNNGVAFIGGGEIHQLDPRADKYLSVVRHADRIKDQLAMRKNMVVLTRSGTIGKVMIVPQHWDGWTASEHIIRIVPANIEMANYVYAWLSSDYAHPLISRFSYGSNVKEISNKHVAQISVPLLAPNAQKRISSKVLLANKKRSKAFELESEALKILNEKVLYARQP